MTDLSQYAESPVLKAADIDPWKILTIAKVEARTFDNGDERLCWSFDETPKYLPGNKTNNRTIFDITGSTLAADQIGHRIVAYSTMVNNPKGRNGPGVRIRSVEEQETIDAVAAARKAKAKPGQVQAPNAKPVREANQEPATDADLDDEIPFN